MTDILDIAIRFEPEAERAEPFGSGNINDTYLVQARDGGKLILQRINQSVFPYPKLIMANMRAMMEHVATQPAPPVPRWELPQVVPTQNGRDYVIDADDEFWRAITFVENARTYPKVRDARHAGEAGFALGTFQRLIK